MCLIYSKRFQSLTGQENFGNINNISSTNGPSTALATSSTNSHVSVTDLESLKQEILSEMRMELQKIKQDIIDGRFIAISKTC